MWINWIFKFLSPNTVLIIGISLIGLGTYLCYLSNDWTFKQFTKLQSKAIVEEINHNMKAQLLTQEDLIGIRVENALAVKLIIDNLTTSEKTVLLLTFLHPSVKSNHPGMIKLSRDLVKDFPNIFASYGSEINPFEMLVKNLITKELITYDPATHIVGLTEKGKKVMKVLIDTKTPPFDLRFEKQN